MPDSNASPTDPSSHEGKHKIFLGFAAGVGKTYAMLDEAHRRKKRGQDVVVGFIDTHGREATREIAGDLEIVPPKQVSYRGASFDEMDVQAIIARHPEVVLVDELEHSNVPNSAHEKRWQDVVEILENGISVISTVNVQHLESLNDQIADIIGIRVSDTVPDQVLHEADEVELVDLTPRALINRLERGDVFPAEKLADDRAAMFSEGALTALREIALREIAGRVDEDVAEYRKQKRIQKPWATTDRVMICVCPSRSSLRLIRKGWRVGQRMHADTIVAYVEDKPAGEKEQKLIRDDFALAERLGIKTCRLHGDVAETLIQYAQENNVTQIVIGHSHRTKVQELVKGSIINELLKELKTVDILVVALDTVEAVQAHG